MKGFRERLTYANVVATLALFLALGGVGYAASQLPKNSVGAKQIKKNAVTGAKVKKHTLTGKNINLAKLGTVPSATSAATASALTALEATHLVGTAGQPPFLDGTITRLPEKGVTFPPVGFYKDHEGIVHLQGLATVGAGTSPIPGLLFSLPAGFRPAPGASVTFPNVEGQEEISIQGAGVNSEEGKDLSGDVFATAGEGTIASLNGITFRAEG